MKIYVQFTGVAKCYQQKVKRLLGELLGSQCAVDENASYSYIATC